MGELTKKRVHWTEYNGEELLHDEDVDILTSADAVTFDDGEDLQYKYTQGQFVSPSTTGTLTNLSTTNKSTLVDAINEVKTTATSNESSIDSLTNRVTPINLGGTGATTASGALTNLGITATSTELNYVDGVTSAIQTQLNNKISIKTGYYSGNGETTRTITLSYTIKAMFVAMRNRPLSEFDTNYEYTLSNSAFGYPSYTTLGLSISGKTFTVSQSTSSSDGRFINLNKNGSQYTYVVFY